MIIDGLWHVNYATQQNSLYENTGDPEQSALITMKDSLASGKDPWGGQYFGNYWLEANVIRAIVIIFPYQLDAETIFDGIQYPFSLELKGEFNSPDFFSMIGHIINYPDQKIALNFSRKQIS